MIALKYNKTGRARFISHIDILRHVTRTLRRAGIDMEFSQGFNPHMQLKMSAPLLLGISSVTEYFTASCSAITADKFLELYNRYCPEDMNGIRAWEVVTNPNFQGLVSYSDYFLPSGKVQDGKVLEILDLPVFEITYNNKGRMETKDVRPLIKDLIITNEGLIMRLALGNLTLRPDRLLDAINNLYGINGDITDVVRTVQYVEKNKELISFDDILDNKG